MTLKEFRSLSKDEQYILLWEKAMLIADRENHEYKYILYQLDSFYIELRLSKHDFTELLVTFSRDRRLNPYLENIDLRSLDVLSIK
ncbi:MAG TPA: hypothetical protein VK489_15055 [Ferruginibacter sp.]|nr:hypothetical protein [Ferruginibacter sp.]